METKLRAYIPPEYIATAQDAAVSAGVAVEVAGEKFGDLVLVVVTSGHIRVWKSHFTRLVDERRGDADGEPDQEPCSIQSLQTKIYAAEHLPRLSLSLSAAANVTRLRILYALSQTKELCVSDLAQLLKISSPATSTHLKRLRNAGLVVSRRQAQTIYYRISHGCTTGILLHLLLEMPD